MKILNGISSVSLQSTRYLTDSLITLGHEARVLIYRSNNLLLGYEDENLNIDPRQTIKLPVYILRILKTFFKSIIKFEVFHFHFGHTFLPKNIDLLILRLLSKKVFMEYHGSEIRRKSIFEKKNGYIDGFSGVDDEKSYQTQKRISKYVTGIIVHDYELLENLYEFNKPIYMLPLRIDLKKFKPIYPEYKDEVIIVHAPSKRKTKGSEYVISAINELSKKYKITFKLIEGLPNEEAKNIISQADIVVDQLIIGSYGMYSIESMALGKPTICYLREDLIEQFPETPPIFNATIHNIKEKLEELIIDYELRQTLGIKGRKYVEKHHNSDLIAKRALEIYGL